MGPAPAKTPPVSIVIPTYNGWHLLERTLPSALDQAFGEVEVIVVDDGSQDDTADHLARAHPEVTVVALPVNRGVAAALNAGIARARGEFVALLNNDVELEADWLSEMVNALASRPDAAWAACKLLSFSARDRLDGAGDVMYVSGGASRRGFGERDTGQYDQAQDVLSASAAAALIRRDAFDAV